MIGMCAADSAISAFENELAEFKTTHKKLVADLASVVQPQIDVLDDLFWDQIDETKGWLGSKAANQCSDNEKTQEEAMSICEEWVAENISNGDTETWVASVLLGNGVEKGRQMIEEALAGS